MGCSKNDNDKDYISISMVQTKPKRSFCDMESEKVESVKRVMYNHCLRYYTLDRCDQKDNGGDYYLCNEHEMETKVVKLNGTFVRAMGGGRKGKRERTRLRRRRNFQLL